MQYAVFGNRKVFVKFATVKLELVSFDAVLIIDVDIFIMASEYESKQYRCTKKVV